MTKIKTSLSDLIRWSLGLPAEGASCCGLQSTEENSTTTATHADAGLPTDAGKDSHDCCSRGQAGFARPADGAWAGARQRAGN